MRSTIFIITTFYGLVLFSCSKKNAEDLMVAREQQNQNTIICEPTGSFSTEVLVIFSNSCMPCHSDSRREGGNSFESYNEAIKVDSSLLLGVIRHESGFLPMPQGGGKLSDCDIKKIELWLENGSPNN
ncbi:MAG: c-type cytochrome [Bacteroidia bacterium]